MFWLDAASLIEASSLFALVPSDFELRSDIEETEDPWLDSKDRCEEDRVDLERRWRFWLDESLCDEDEDRVELLLLPESSLVSLSFAFSWGPAEESAVSCFELLLLDRCSDDDDFLRFEILGTSIASCCPPSRLFLSPVGSSWHKDCALLDRWLLFLLSVLFSFSASASRSGLVVLLECDLRCLLPPR